jgi:uncharacterized membrane protein
MSDAPVQLIVVAYKDDKSAEAALKALKQAQKEKMIRIENAAVLRKDEKGKLHIKETADMGGKKGAALGGVAGAAIGVIAGPALLVPAAVGALIGGLTAKLRDTGFSDARLQQVGEGLKPGSSAIIAVVEHTWVDDVKKALAQEQADMFAQSLSADISEQLDAGHEVAYTAISSEHSFAASRIAGGEDEVEGSQVVVDDSGVYGGQFVATKEGFAVVAMEATDEGMTVASLTGTPAEQSKMEEKPDTESKSGDRPAGEDGKSSAA